MHPILFSLLKTFVNAATQTGVCVDVLTRFWDIIDSVIRNMLKSGIDDTTLNNIKSLFEIYAAPKS